MLVAVYGQHDDDILRLVSCLVTCNSYNVCLMCLALAALWLASPGRALSRGFPLMRAQASGMHSTLRISMLVLAQNSLNSLRTTESGSMYAGFMRHCTTSMACTQTKNDQLPAMPAAGPPTETTEAGMLKVSAYQAFKCSLRMVQQWQVINRCISGSTARLPVFLQMIP